MPAIGDKVIIREMSGARRRESDSAGRSGTVSAETRISWVIEIYGRELCRVPKKHDFKTAFVHQNNTNYPDIIWFDETAMRQNDAETAWRGANHYHIVKGVEYCQDVEVLREIAKLLGLEVKP